MSFRPRTYKKDLEYSYTLGAYPTIELLKTFPQHVIKVYFHSTCIECYDMVYQICQTHTIPVETNDKIFRILSQKENCFIIGVFYKCPQLIRKENNHIVLVSPSNMGNLGTIIRTAVGFEISDIAIISGGVDIFHPKVIRASMGAIFHASIEYLDTIAEYQLAFGDRTLFAFMLDGVSDLDEVASRPEKLFSLVFGNEATGLSDEYKQISTSISIKHGHKIDSLNLPIAVAIALHSFSRR